mmetsp:Transcript_20517/g.56959  ORF Transcript_20517/g.56959 Transcript_20517/m.56959 type:complete len:420 (-) Transcript_20517:107-1366(-)
MFGTLFKSAPPRAGNSGAAGSASSSRKEKVGHQSGSRGNTDERSAAQAGRRPAPGGRHAQTAKRGQEAAEVAQGKRRRDQQEATPQTDLDEGPAATEPKTIGKSRAARRRAERRRAAEAANAGAMAENGMEPPKKRCRDSTLSSNGDDATVSTITADALPQPPTTLLSAVGKQSKLGRAAERLKGSRFRWLNEMLYSATGEESKDVFDKDPSLAFAYHEGFRAQRAKWPWNPLDTVIKWLREDVPKGAVIGDFGCGEARIGLELGARNTVHSFDLIAVNERVTPCNLANVPLADASLDIAVFCLALMGTDWLRFLQEAYRCLKPDGLCHIVEVESRFEDMDAVIRSIEAIGFRKVFFNPSSFFVELRFARGCAKEKRPKGTVAAGQGKKRKARGKAGAGSHADPASGAGMLRACIYRRR